MPHQREAPGFGGMAIWPTTANATADNVRGCGAKVAGLNGRSGAAERYRAASQL